MSETPSWNDLKRQIAGPKPPVRARVVESSPTLDREARVLHDVRDGWHVTEGAKTELSSVDSTTIVDPDRFETIHGLAVCNGMEMLVRQAEIAFERWTGISETADVMRSALEAWLPHSETER